MDCDIIGQMQLQLIQSINRLRFTYGYSRSEAKKNKGRDFRGGSVV